jgi:hypothetical protein
MLRGIVIREVSTKEAYMCRLLVAFGIAIVSTLTLACSNPTGSATAPTSIQSASLEQPGIVTSASSQSALAIHGQLLTPVIGTGSGIVDVTPTAAVDGSFSAQINVNVHGAPPNTTFYVQRAPEIGRPNSADGVCQRAAGLTPWGPPAPNFVTFPLPAPAPLITLETSSGGAGALHIDFAALAIADDTQFDVMFRLVDSLTSPTNELRTGCFTVTVK